MATPPFVCRCCGAAMAVIEFLLRRPTIRAPPWRPCARHRITRPRRLRPLIGFTRRERSFAPPHRFSIVPCTFRPDSSPQPASPAPTSNLPPIATRPQWRVRLQPLPSNRHRRSLPRTASGHSAVSSMEVYSTSARSGLRTIRALPRACRATVEEA